MKAKKGIALALALALVLLVSSAALAIPSPTGSTVAGTSANVSKVEVKSVSSVKKESLTLAAQAYISNQIGADYRADALLVLDLIVTRTDNRPVTIALNVAGVQPGDVILVSHEKADGTVEIVPAKVPAGGVVEFTLREPSPIAIVRVAPKGAVPAPVMPKTGDNTSAVPAALLLAACIAVVGTCGRALKKAL
ncbi:MAG: hypothetical protein PHO41_05075 [Eubacteriales bacterium]|nr:hypothetical protein [Eubacteriales bacterium]